MSGGGKEGKKKGGRYGGCTSDGRLLPTLGTVRRAARVNIFRDAGIRYIRTRTVFTDSVEMERLVLILPFGIFG